MAWLVYGVVESALSIGIQLWRFREMEVLPWQWPLLGMLFAAYACAGMVAGALGGLLLNARKTPDTHRIFAALTVSAAFAANLISAWPLARSEQIVLAVAAVLIVVFVAALVSAEPAKRWNFLAGPWTVSLLLLGVPSLSRELLTPQDSSLKKTGLSILLLCFIVAVAAAVAYIRKNRPATLVSQAIAVVGAIALFSAAVAVAQRDAPVNVNLSPARASTPNVVLIVMDTVRADHLSLYGYSRDTTPNLRQFARQATLYTRATAASDFTLATHATMFTGVYPDWNGAVNSTVPNPIALPVGTQYRTLAEVLRSRGYWSIETAANSGFLAAWTGLTKGFAIPDLRRPVTLSSADRPFYLRERAKRLLAHIFDTGAFDRPHRIAADINRRAIDLLDAAKSSGVPFFLFANYMDAHTPYVPAPPYNRQFSSTTDAPLDASALHDIKLQVDAAKRTLRPAESQYLIGKYDGGIAAEDSAIKALLDRLRELGLYDNTLIIVTADHGDTFGEHDLMDHFVGFVYQELVHVPLIVKYPGQHEAAKFEDLVSQVDLMPTVLEAIGAEPLRELQGKSLLHATADPGRVVFSRGTRSPLVGLGNQRFGGLRRAIFSGNLKLIGWTAGPPELYDLTSDPQEQHDLYQPGDPRAQELSKRLDDWAASAPHHASQGYKLDRSATERLKSLGYVQ
ncbi:MAG: sulfatase [Bryobacterales bacterium]|nr:sulfatase [Bryobacterales bacterium]MBV9396729.1 sulfatase [Bryobacterales bacterium]